MGTPESKRPEVRKYKLGTNTKTQLQFEPHFQLSPFFDSLHAMEALGSDRLDQSLSDPTEYLGARETAEGRTKKSLRMDVTTIRRWGTYIAAVGLTFFINVPRGR